MTHEATALFLLAEFSHIGHVVSILEGVQYCSLLWEFGPLLILPNCREKNKTPSG